MNILYAGSEAAPFIKTGGLGDVMGALPKYISKLGNAVKVVLPKYKNINQNFVNKLNFIKSFTVQVGWREQYCGVFYFKYEGVEFYFIDNEYYFNRDGMYGYYDDGEKFAYFSRAVLGLINEMDWNINIVHCNDWQTGMIPVLHKLEYKSKGEKYNFKTVFSIHNLFYQGILPKECLGELFGYDYESYNNNSIRINDGISFLKGGINYSDRIVAVSKNYAKEIQCNEYGEGLDYLLKERNNFLVGIENGIDYDEYDPSTDKFIYNNYSLDDIESKKENKKRLQIELSLPVRRDVPILSIVSRLTKQKGINLIIDKMEELIKKDVQVIFLGTGEYGYEEAIKEFSYRYPDKISANIKFDNVLAHKVYAGSDIFLMPSKFEPCGLGQLIALRYGVIPVVRETGGLKDTVVPYNEYTKVGTGFSFRNYDSNEFMMITNYALEKYRDRESWKNIIRQSMDRDSSWKKSAGEYIELYKSIL